MRFTHTETRTVERTVVLPEWMALAVRGERIEAIKTLREAAGLDVAGNKISLGQAKRLVDQVTDCTEVNIK